MSMLLRRFAAASQRWVLGVLLLCSSAWSQQPGPTLRLYADTALTACPVGERLEYFYFWFDLPERRGSTWCGAAQADLDVGNATDPHRWRIPYLLDSCTAGVDWRSSHAFPDGTRYHSPAYRGINMVCSAQPEPPPPGCAAGAGGFAACSQDPPPDASPPPEGGPSADSGPPGKEETEARSCRAEESQAAEGVGNPIFAGTGNKYQREVDFQGPSGLDFVRHYNSSLPGWVHNHGMRVLAASDKALVIRSDGRALRFSGAGVGEWAAEPGTTGRLLKLGTDGSFAWRFITADDTQEDFDGQGRLLRATRRGGHVTTMVWRDGLLQAVRDPFGRSLQMAYDTSARLVRVTTADGNAIDYGYDGSGRLAQVTYGDGTRRQYLYEDGRWPLALTGLVDEAGQRHATWSYDSAGRAISSEHAGVMRYQLSYAADGSVRIVGPLGQVREQRYQRAGQRQRLSAQDQPCVGCIGDVATRTVDAATGLTLDSQDFLGVNTLFT